LAALLATLTGLLLLLAGLLPAAALLTALSGLLVLLAALAALLAALAALLAALVGILCHDFSSPVNRDVPAQGQAPPCLLRSSELPTRCDVDVRHHHKEHNDMDTDRISGTARNLGGKVEEGIGRAVGDTETQVRGKVDQAMGTAQDLYGQAKDTAADAAHAIGQGAAVADDYVRNIIEDRPYTVAFAALAIGFLLGRAGRSS
jgi:uncharacterized protein YjbJ (UPF0337 family)